MCKGELGDDRVGVSRTEPVVLIVLSPTVADRLAQGQDVVSGDYHLLDNSQAAEHGVDGVDILVVGSAGTDSRYIMNPGRNLLSDVFGASTTGNACEHDSAHAAISAG